MSNEGQNSNTENNGHLAKLVNFFLRGSVTPVLILFSLIAGLVAMTLTPREEEPQIVVPMADIFIQAPGLAPAEVERQIATPLEKLLNQIDGVEHVYSASASGQATVTVRFYVGEDRERSLVKIYNKIYSNTDMLPPDVTDWVVKPIEIDDVPIVIISLWSELPNTIDDYALRRIAEELDIELQALPGTNITETVGGRPRTVRVELDPQALAARNIAALDVAWALNVSNIRQSAGQIDQNDTNIQIDVGDHIAHAQELDGIVVNVVNGIPVHLRDVAQVFDGPAERTSYSWMGFGPADSAAPVDQEFYPAVHISIAKKKGTNAVHVADSIEERMAELARATLPDGVKYRITRNHGETANDKVNELLEALLVAIIIVIGLIAYSLGWREGLIVAAAVPITFAITLMINYWFGYTINRVTLFALILSLGLVVDDPIVGVENIYRHLQMGKETPLRAVRSAVNEVLPPIVLATLAVIISFLPMFLITGMMGPYMAPMALNVPVAMMASMFVALTITPWLSYYVLRNVKPKKKAPHVSQDTADNGKDNDSGMKRIYEPLIRPLLESDKKAKLLLWGTGLLFMGAVALGAMRAVPLKMLPYDNKNEFQIVVDMPEGSTLERTDALTRQLAGVLRRAPEVRDFQVFSGIPSPMDFNGMVRHSFLRQGPNVADIRVNLVGKRNRSMQSHAMGLRLRDELEAIASAEGARIAITEVPAGPPVLSTITAEIYGDLHTPYESFRSAALIAAARLKREPGVSDVDTSVEAEASRLVFVTDQEKAALSGISAEDIAQTLSMALSGLDAAQMHLPGEANPLPIRLRLNRAERSSVEALSSIIVRGREGITRTRSVAGVEAAPMPLVSLGEIGHFEERPIEQAIYHKDLQRTALIYAEAVGRAPAEIVADVNADMLSGPDQPHMGHVDLDAAPRPVDERSFISSGGGINWSLPAGTDISWFGEGELKITKDVFIDLGIAFGVALIGIYMLLVYQTASYAMPLILMISIPLTMIGIMPGFWLLNAIGTSSVAGYQDPIFFTATAMIGMIALSGLAVRNAILLIEFLHEALARGVELTDAIVEAGSIRIRAILLTAGTAMLAAIPITLDPIFAGLAWSLIFGLFVSTAFTLFVVPLTYYLVYRNTPGHGLPMRGLADEDA